MKAPFRTALLIAASLGGFAVAPSEGADSTLPPARSAGPLGPADHWRLRPAEHAPAPLPELRGPRGRMATDIPEARRQVRLVYPALIEAR